MKTGCRKNLEQFIHFNNSGLFSRQNAKPDCRGCRRRHKLRSWHSMTATPRTRMNDCAAKTQSLSEAKDNTGHSDDPPVYPAD